jgi:hypothetical protein
MAHWDAARIAIESRLATGWGTTTPIRYWSSGVPFEIPSVPYLAIQVEEFDAQQITLGGTPQTHRYFGIITIQVLVPERTGSKIAAGHCDTLDPLFRRAQFSQGDSGVILCRTPQARTIGTSDGWYQMNLVIPFQRDKIH